MKKRKILWLSLLFINTSRLDFFTLVLHGVQMVGVSLQMVCGGEIGMAFQFLLAVFDPFEILTFPFLFSLSFEFMYFV